MFSFFKKHKTHKEVFRTHSESPISKVSIVEEFQNNEDFNVREINIGNVFITLAYIDGLIDNKLTSDFILKPLITNKIFKTAKSDKEVLELIEKGKIYFTNQKITVNSAELISGILDGNTALIFEDEKKAVLFDNKGFSSRAITESSSESAIKGSKDSFVENLRINTTIIRRKIKSSALKFESFDIGRQSHTKVDLVYMSNIADPELVTKIKDKLSNIDVDEVISLSNIIEYLEENKYTLFPQVIHTERSDKFCANMIEGRAGIIIDGVPAGYIVPATFTQCLQAPEDYAQNYVVASIVRLMRFLLVSIAVLLPALYTAVTIFHQELIPTNLALSIDASKEGTPFYSFIEVILMLLAFEIILEAGLRLPKTIGYAVTIVGAVLVGQAASDARFVSPAVVIVVAMTAIAGFAIPNQDFSNAIRLWRMLFVFFAAFSGLFGVTAGAILLLHHLSKIQLFGIPYLAPLVSSNRIEWEDSIFRFRMPENLFRPHSISPLNIRRRKREK